MKISLPLIEFQDWFLWLANLCSNLRTAKLCLRMMTEQTQTVPEIHIHVNCNHKVQVEILYEYIGWLRVQNLIFLQLWCTVQYILVFWVTSVLVVYYTVQYTCHNIIIGYRRCVSMWYFVWDELVFWISKWFLAVIRSAILYSVHLFLVSSWNHKCFR